jgi:hypothetical protein
VPRGTAELRVALNSTDGVDANLDLFVKAGEGASPSFSDCAASGDGPHGFCSMGSPAVGSWSIQVVAPGRSGTVGGDFQMTATLIGGAPVGVDDAYAVDQDGTLEIDAAGGVLANDEGTARGALSAAIDREPEHGTVELASDGSFRYQPEAGFAGEDSFSYQASDGSYHGPAEVVLTVGGSGDGDGMMGGCDAAGGSAGGSGLLLLLAMALGLRISQTRCGSRRS